jgi:hypothetical protein
MDAYQSEIFEFLTKRSNFDSLAKAMSHYEMIRKELLNRFWILVKTELDSKTTGSTWQVSLDTNIFARYSKLQIYKKEWKRNDLKPLFSITWESLSCRPYSGLLLYMDTKGIDMSLVRASALKLKPDNFTSDNNLWWAWWKHGNIDFENAIAVSTILPDKIDEVAKEWARELYELAMVNEKQIDVINAVTL